MVAAIKTSPRTREAEERFDNWVVSVFDTPEENDPAGYRDLGIDGSPKDTTLCRVGSMSKQNFKR